MTTTAPVLAAGTWTIDPVHSDITFSVRHLGVSKVRGSFTDFSGEITVAEDGTPSVSATIDVASVSTRNDQRDGHLRSADFFDTENHPTATYRSTSVRAHPEAGGNDYIVDGELTLHGVTEPVSLNLSLEGVGAGAQGGAVAGFEASAEINRGDFGVTGGAGLVGEKVTLTFNIEAGHPEAPSN
ncbi:YceI family protein [Mycobacteroides salmoniphilum]|uniref:YceI family protein n=1 Tax=Mycobacteroides salmoniphilum TaxID=404941 RepID=UPI000992ECF4|nr:YceI family protein [Mycobacteroides salmoniphilum]QCH26085.1 Protein YceI [Mycobacteroides salmoniphilum]